MLSESRKYSFELDVRPSLLVWSFAMCHVLGRGHIASEVLRSFESTASSRASDGTSAYTTTSSRDAPSSTALTADTYIS
jgi:hypothetical protein